MKNTNESPLKKFLTAQEGVYPKALAEIRSGKKKTHWMWFIFPQLRALGFSDMAKTYGIADLDEAKAYLADPILGTRLRQITEALLNLGQQDPVKIFGDIDAMKLRSCMTLFARVDEDSVFTKVLQQYFDGKDDDKTNTILKIQSFDFTL